MTQNADRNREDNIPESIQYNFKCHKNDQGFILQNHAAVFWLATRIDGLPRHLTSLS
jgi:hypothetical protein